MPAHTKKEKLEKEQKIAGIAGGLYNIYIEAGKLDNFLGFLDTAVFLAREVSKCYA